MVSFGVTFMLDPPVSRVVEWSRLAEERGFDYVWAWDSHVLWQEFFTVFALIAANTQRVRMGPCVTNPATRDVTVTASALATLQEVSGGRMDMGMGRGDSARRVIGKTPVTEGLIMQLADPYILEWSLQYVRQGAEEAGRRFEDIKIQVAAPGYITEDPASAREQVRWFPALVSNHVVDLVKRYSTTDLPQELTDYIKAREHYDYSDHGRTGADHAEFVTDEVVDRFCVIGTPERVTEKLRELEALGMDQFNIYSMVEDPGPEGIIRDFGRQVIPAFRSS